MRCLARFAGGLTGTRTAASSSASSTVTFFKDCNCRLTSSIWLRSFSAALHPPTRELELKTLVAGGFSIAHPTSEPSSPPGAAAPAFPPSPSSSASQARSAAQDPIGPALRALLHETSDALDSPDAALVRALSLDSMFSLLLQRLEPAFVGAAGGAGAGSAAGEGRGARFEDVSEKTTRLASLLPFVTKLAGTTGGERGVLSHGVNGNEFVEVRSGSSKGVSPEQG